MSQHNSSLPKSAIRDNRHRGTVGDFLKAKVEENSTLSIVSAYFTIYAFDALKEQLLGIKSLKFLFGEPRFIKSLDPSKTDKKAYLIIHYFKFKKDTSYEKTKKQTADY